MHLIYHPEAEAELIDAARFHDRRVASLGAQFLNMAIVPSWGYCETHCVGGSWKRMSGGL